MGRVHILWLMTPPPAARAPPLRGDREGEGVRDTRVCSIGNSLYFFKPTSFSSQWMS